MNREPSRHDVFTTARIGANNGNVAPDVSLSKGVFGHDIKANFLSTTGPCAVYVLKEVYGDAFRVEAEYCTEKLVLSHLGRVGTDESLAYLSPSVIFRQKISGTWHRFSQEKIIAYWCGDSTPIHTSGVW